MHSRDLLYAIIPDKPNSDHESDEAQDKASSFGDEEDTKNVYTSISVIFTFRWLPLLIRQLRVFPLLAL